MDELQSTLSAEAKHAVLVVLQGRDAAGKDGTLRKVFNAVGVVFKGSGFYKNDSRGKSSSAEGGGTKTETKTETKSESGSSTSASKPAPAAAKAD